MSYLKQQSFVHRLAEKWGVRLAQAVGCSAPEAWPIGSVKAACLGESREMDLHQCALFALSAKATAPCDNRVCHKVFFTRL